MMLYENTRTVYDLVHNAAAEHGDRVFLQYEENGIIFRVTYKEFADECDAIAAWAREKRAQVGHKLKVGILGVSTYHNSTLDKTCILHLCKFSFHLLNFLFAQHQTIFITQSC